MAESIIVILACKKALKEVAQKKLDSSFARVDVSKENGFEREDFITPPNWQCF